MKKSGGLRMLSDSAIKWNSKFGVIKVMRIKINK